MGPRSELRVEADALGRYVLGRPVPAELAERYVVAHDHVAMDESSPGDRAILRFALAHRAALPCLDAAAALVRPHSLLHRKALLMTAILEASPDAADDFLPRSVGWLRLITLGATVGVATIAQLTVGMPLLLVLQRRS
jgi:hypothetical protein